MKSLVENNSLWKNGMFILIKVMIDELFRKRKSKLCKFVCICVNNVVVFDV